MVSSDPRSIVCSAASHSRLLTLSGVCLLIANPRVQCGVIVVLGEQPLVLGPLVKEVVRLDWRKKLAPQHHTDCNNSSTF